jgi:ATP-binding cassette subfamily F protein 3
MDRNYSEQNIRRFLGSFNFHGDKVKEEVATFSGGEKARLALAIIAFKKPNLLLMDEPTNHLDMEMRQALTVALQSFSGALLLISHDRHLLANTVNQFLLVDGGGIETFDGDLSDYRKIVLGSVNTPIKNVPVISEKSASEKSASEKSVSKKSVSRKQDHKKSKQLRTRIGTMEKKLERLQRKLTEVETHLSAPDSYEEGYGKDEGAGLHALIRDQVELKDQIHEIENKWLELHSDLEALS